MKKIFYSLLLIPILLVGCMATSKYIPYTQEQFQSKKADYPIATFEKTPEPIRNYKVIGKVMASGDTKWGTTWENIYTKMINTARKEGANGIINCKYEYKEYAGTYSMPGYTTYQTQTTHHSGSVSGMTNYDFGSMHSNTQGTYSGTSTTRIPIYHPGAEIPYSGAMLYGSGELVVFQDTNIFDKLADKGIYKSILPLYPLDIPNIKDLDKNFIPISITPGFPFERAGIRNGDIISRINGKDFNNATDISDYMGNLPSDQEVEIEIKRGDAIRNFSVKPKIERPRFGFDFIPLEKDFYQEYEITLGSETMRGRQITFKIDQIIFRVILDLDRIGMLCCEMTVVNLSDKEFKLSPEYFRILANNVPLERLSLESLLLFDPLFPNVSVEQREKLGKEFDKQILKDTKILPGETLVKKLWFSNERLDTNIELKITLNDGKAKSIFFDAMRD